MWLKARVKKRSDARQKTTTITVGVMGVGVRPCLPVCVSVCVFERMFELSAQLPRRNEINRTLCARYALNTSQAYTYAYAHAYIYIKCIHICIFVASVVIWQLDTFRSEAVFITLAARNVP